MVENGVTSYKDIYDWVLKKPKKNKKEDIDELFKTYIKFNNPKKY